MELRDLRAFVVLAEVLHFGQAASRLHLTQSALSKQIQRLEQGWGGALFERSGGATRLTALGEALLADSQRLLVDATQLERRAEDLVAGVSGRLRIGFGVATKRLVPQVIARFRELKPQVKIELHDLSTHHQLQGLQAGTLDLAFCRLPAPAGWPVLAVERASFVAVLPQQWAQQPELVGPAGPKLQALAQRPLATVARPLAPAFHDHLMSFLAGAAAGTPLRELQPVSDFASAVALAAAGVAWAIVPSSTPIDQPQVQALPLTAAEAGWQVGLMRPPGSPDPLVAAFWQVVAEMVTATQGQS